MFVWTEFIAIILLRNISIDINVGLMSDGRHSYPPCENKSGKRGGMEKVFFYNGLMELCSGKITEELRERSGGNLFVDFDQIFLVVLAHTATALVW